MGRPYKYGTKLAEPRPIRLTEEQERRLTVLNQYYSLRVGGVSIDVASIIRRALDLGLSTLEAEFEENKQ